MEPSVEKPYSLCITSSDGMFSTIVDVKLSKYDLYPVYAALQLAIAAHEEDDGDRAVLKSAAHSLGHIVGILAEGLTYRNCRDLT